jgi:hypothetical protein
MANRSHCNHGFSWKLKSSVDEDVSSNYYSQMEFKKQVIIAALLPSNSKFCVLDKIFIYCYTESG